MKILGNGNSIFDFCIEGKVVHVDDPETMLGQIHDCIIVTKTPAPVIAILLKECIGIVSENGGIVSHLAIVAMEMGVPAVLGVQEIWSRVADGTTVRIESKNGLGTVYEVD